MTLDVYEIDSLAELDELKRRYIQRTTGPLDGMWLCGFVPQATHYAFSLAGERVGYCCVDEGRNLLQFFVGDAHEARASTLFERIVVDGDSPMGAVTGAFVSTAEPAYLSLCLDHLARFEVNALMYRLEGERRSVGATGGPELPLRAVTAPQLPAAVAFAMEAIGAPAQWLTSYYSRLISRGELLGLWDGERLIATGENRGYDELQVGYADLGVVVGKPHRGKGIATRILKELVARNDREGLASICSTEKTNVAAQKAIEGAGFIARNRILRFHA